MMVDVFLFWFPDENHYHCFLRMDCIHFLGLFDLFLHNSTGARLHNYQVYTRTMSTIYLYFFLCVGKKSFVILRQGWWCLFGQCLRKRRSRFALYSVEHRWWCFIFGQSCRNSSSCRRPLNSGCLYCDL